MYYKFRKHLVLGFLCLQLVGCSRSRMSENSHGPVLKIAVKADGRITVDGTPATIDSVRASLKRLAEQKGVVWYYREAGQGVAPTESIQVIQSVIDNRLPIRLSTHPDFSNAIGRDGQPITDGTADK
jgi:hypothetical protein